MKKVIIVGGSDGLGLELSKILTEKGNKVVCLARNNPNVSGIDFIPCDLLNGESVDQATDIIKGDHGKFDTVVFVAGVFSSGSMGSLELTDLQRVMNTNAVGILYFVSKIFNLIKKNEADIICTSSTVGFKAYKNQSIYGMSKWAVRGLVENLRLELVDTRCRVTNFAPGGFKSKFVQKYTGDESVDLSGYMDSKKVAEVLVHVLDTPKEMEISEIIINRKMK